MCNMRNECFSSECSVSLLDTRYGYCLSIRNAFISTFVYLCSILESHDICKVQNVYERILVTK
jgi:hypothetical protein